MKIADRLHTIQRLFLDTAPIIYYVEANRNYLIRLEPIFASLDVDGLVAVTSPITLAECLIMPYRHHYPGLQQAFSDLVIRGSNVLFVPIHDEIATQAAQLRAHYNLTLTDALQIAVALETRCDAFLTNDLALKRVSELEIMVLDDYE